MTHSFNELSLPRNHADLESYTRIFDTILKQVDKNFPDQVNLVVNTTWIDMIPDQLREKFLQLTVDNLFLIGTIDNLNLVEYPANVTVYQVGNIIDKKFNQYYFSSSAIVLSDIFRTYTDDQLVLTHASSAYLCYQNKPSSHRQLLTSKLMRDNLLNCGVITLSKGNRAEFDFPELYQMTVDESPDITFYGPFKENPYSLGDISIWKNCFLNVISETLPISSNHFISEKTYKPIIGMRPFVLNGDPRILTYLSDLGFHTFEEYWPDIHFRDCSNMDEVTDSVISVIHRIANMSPATIYEMYTEMLPKLRHNRERFFQHAREQEHILTHLFES